MSRQNKLMIKEFEGTKRQKLTAIKFLRYPLNSTTQIWLFACECGGIKEMRKYNFLNSSTNNCGCEHGLTRHGTAGGSRIKRRGAYNSWVNMRSRCNNPNLPDFKYYGGRGIKHCERWNKFENFLEDMGEPKFGYTLDRIDNNGDYTPENCKWASRKEQSNNRNYNAVITYKGKTQSVGKWADEIGINITTRNLYKRVFTDGWDVEKAFTQPLRQS